MDILGGIRDGLALIAEGKKALASVTDAIKDGTTGADADTLEEAQLLLDQEETESQAAHDNLKSAIDDARSKF